MTTTATTARESLARRHPLIFFFVLAYAISWPFWLLASQLGGSLRTLVIVIGGFGPAIAAAVTLWRSGGSLSEWARGIVRWRVPVRYYLYALGLPVLIMVGMNLVLAVLGQQPAWSSLPDRVPGYLQTFLLTAVIFGGQEEPGWRGFALPRLQSRHSPLIATLILGLGVGNLARPSLRAGRVRRAVGARLSLHLALQQDQQHPALHPAACQPHPSPRSFAADRGLADGGCGTARHLRRGRRHRDRR